MMGNRDIRSLRYDDVAALDVLSGLPSYRADQLFHWLHGERVGHFSEMLNLPGDLRSRLQEEYSITQPQVSATRVSSDGSVKILYELEDGSAVETVVMRYRTGLSVCLSCQVGCAMGCAFCASATGLQRNLTPSEILGQLYEAHALYGRPAGVVLMGIGEPLDNLESVLDFCSIATDSRGYGLSNRGVTISTCGLVPGIRRLAQDNKPYTLAVSLHAPDDERRSRIMPVNRRYPIADLMAACRDYTAATHRRITFEYAVMDGFNNRAGDAESLVAWIAGMGAHVNVIPVNPVRAAFHATRQTAVQFARQLHSLGQNATVRRTLGEDIEAACGQLRSESSSNTEKQKVSTEQLK